MANTLQVQSLSLSLSIYVSVSLCLSHSTLGASQACASAIKSCVPRGAAHLHVHTTHNTDLSVYLSLLSYPFSLAHLTNPSVLLVLMSAQQGAAAHTHLQHQRTLRSPHGSPRPLRHSKYALSLSLCVFLSLLVLILQCSSVHM